MAGDYTISEEKIFKQRLARFRVCALRKKLRECSGDIEESSPSTFDIQRKLVKIGFTAASSGTVQSYFSPISPSSAVELERKCEWNWSVHSRVLRVADLILIVVVVGGAVFIAGGVAAAAAPQKVLEKLPGCREERRKS
ncbi:unnamed protein product [Sphenostylis stenocarpa]|uniref:Uncharacterized protein n=1 Tax=Sphenostylis stenocarpa TaxID=92480 RepID=A0AA86V6C4_9FABA|nr:unnamed protein product [Sphenostylis stenocarpa]